MAVGSGGAPGRPERLLEQRRWNNGAWKNCFGVTCFSGSATDAVLAASDVSILQGLNIAVGNGNTDLASVTGDVKVGQTLNISAGNGAGDQVVVRSAAATIQHQNSSSGNCGGGSGSANGAVAADTVNIKRT